MMQRSHLHAQRGQALLEMVISLPLFLLCLFGLIWATREATTAERVQMGLRYGALNSEYSQPYNSYSLYALYGTIDGSPPVSLSACSVADTSGLTVNRHTFFKPTVVATPQCAAGSTAFTVNQGFSQTSFLQNSYMTLGATVQGSNFLTSSIPNLRYTSAASQNFFYSPSIEMLTCETDAGYYIKANLEGFYDNSAASLATESPIGNGSYYYATVSPHACTTFSPYPTPNPADTVLPSAPAYTAPPKLATPTPCNCSTPTPLQATPAPTGSPGSIS